jgi:hypothetical protein
VYHPNYDNHVYRNITIRQTNTEPFNRGHDDDSVQYGILTVDGLTFDGCRSGGMPLIQISDNNPTGNAITHIRNLKTVNWSDNSRARSIANLGGGPRRQPKTEKGVPIYIHDWFDPGKAAMVVSTRSGEFKASPDKFRVEAPLTGNESRVAEVSGVAFPEPLQPVDDLPPATVITRVIRGKGAVKVLGTTTDNGTIKAVRVNGQSVSLPEGNFGGWEITLKDVPTGSLKVEAKAEDEAGNVEKTPAVVMVK